MASTVVVPTSGRFPTPFNYSRVNEKRKKLKEAIEKAKNSGVIGIMHENSYINVKDVKLCEKNEYTQVERKLLKTSINMVDFISARELNSFGKRKFNTKSILKKYLVQNIIEEREIILGSDIDAVFSSTWIDSSSILMGTNCQKILKYDTKENVLSVVRSQPIIDRNSQEPVYGPIHMMVTNPSKTLVATGGTNPSNVAIYTIPDMTPFKTGVGGHESWLSNGAWVNDEVLMTVGSDCRACLWRINENDRQELMDSSASWECARKSHIISGIAYSKALGQSACLSLTGSLNILDVEKFTPIHKCRLPARKDVACIITNETGTLYATGGHTCALLVDARSLKTVRKISAAGIRSMTMVDDLLTMGNIDGLVKVFDMSAGKYLLSPKFLTRRVHFRTDLGYEYIPDTIFRGRIIPSVNTHCFDESYTRLFTAGGPPEIGDRCLYVKSGNYAALWQ